MRRFYLLLFLIVCWGTLQANRSITIGHISFKTADGDEDPPPYGDFKTLAVPIKRAGNLIVIEAKIDSMEGNFILDTGAPFLVLNETYFRDLPSLDDGEAAGVTGATSYSFTTVVNNFSILDLQYYRITAQVTDLSFIENGRHIKVLGLMGTRLFSKFAVTVDLFRNVLYIQKLDKDGNIPDAERVYHDRFMVSPFRYLNDMVFLKGTIGNNSLLFAFDTAAETNLFDFKQSKKLAETLEIVGRQKLTGIGAATLDVVYARFDKLIIGDRMFMKNRILLTNLENMGKAYGRTVDGVLGYDFFIRGIFTINFAKREFEMYIYTNQ